MFTKKITTFVALLLVLSVAALSGVTFAAEKAPKAGAKAAAKTTTIADQFLGEELVYKISFWFFKNMAVGKVLFKEDPDSDGYLAIMNAYTTGAVDRLVQRRHDYYVARLALSDDGTRFLTKSLSTQDSQLDKMGRRQRREERCSRLQRGALSRRSVRRFLQLQGRRLRAA
jgi:hypothetical protein